MTTSLVIAVMVGIIIGTSVAFVILKRRYKKDDHIQLLLERGHITANEAREMRATGKPPSRLTRGALSPYGDDE